MGNNSLQTYTNITTGLGGRGEGRGGRGKGGGGRGEGGGGGGSGEGERRHSPP